MPVLVNQGKIVPEGKDSSTDNGEQGDTNGQQQQTNAPNSQETQEQQTEGSNETETATLPLTDSKVATEGEGEKEPSFPLDILASLDEQLNRPRWVVPVLPKSDLETLLEASIKLAREGRARSGPSAVLSKLPQVQGSFVAVTTPICARNTLFV